MAFVTLISMSWLILPKPSRCVITPKLSVTHHATPWKHCWCMRQRSKMLYYLCARFIKTRVWSCAFVKKLSKHLKRLASRTWLMPQKKIGPLNIWHRFCRSRLWVIWMRRWSTSIITVAITLIASSLKIIQLVCVS